MKIKKELKIAFIIIGIFGVLILISNIVEMFDTGTPEEKEQQAQEHLMKEYEKIKRNFPSMELDGKIKRIEIQWLDNKAIIFLPKTYGFGATRFKNKTVSLTKEDFLRCTENSEHLFLNKEIEIWRGPSPSWGFFKIAIPKFLVPNRFRADSTKKLIESKP